MNMQTPLEGLLRPPLEWIATATSVVISWILVHYFYIFFLPKSYSIIVAVLVLAFGGYRFLQGYKVWKYQYKLRITPGYNKSQDKFTYKTNKLFLGKGFAWTPKHTQRLRDLDFSYNLHFKKKSIFKKYFKDKKLGGEPSLHAVGEKDSNISINIEERASHLLVLGLPGMGKTRFAELLISQDIRRGDVVIVLDPKGDIDLLKRMYSEAVSNGREDDLLIFHLGFPQQSCRYNPIGNFTRVTEVANRITNQLPSSGEAAAFKEFGWQFVNSIAMALVAMGEKPDYKKIKFYITKMDALLERYLSFWLPQVDENYKEWVLEYQKRNCPDKSEASYLKSLIAYVEHKKLNNNPIFDDLNNAYRYDREYYSKITASLGPLLKKLTTGKSAKLLSPNYNDIEDDRPILDWLQVIRNRQIVYVGLDALTDPVVASAVGNAMFSDLVSVAGRLYKFGIEEGFFEKTKEALPRVCLHSDEFNEIIGDEFIPLLNKGRGAGFTVTAYTQTWSDVEARLKTAAKAGQVAGNFGTVIMFRCKEAATVEMFLSQLPIAPILRPVPSSNSSDTSHGKDGIYYHSTNSDQFNLVDQRLIEQNDVLNLPKGQAFCLLEGGKLYKLRVPLPSENPKNKSVNLETILKI